MADSDTLEPNSNYKLESLIAEGTRARVYLASDQNGRKVVIKFLLESEFPDNEIASKHIAHELRCLTLGAHQNVVKQIGSGTNASGRPYLIIEHVPGKTLKDLLSSGEQDPQVMVNMFIQLTHAIENLHKVGLLHLDLRPDKIIIADTSKKELSPTLIGFGRAGLLPWAGREIIVEPPGKCGLYSLQYISPEQAIEKRCLANSDVYSLACVMYEAISGQPPFRGENELHMMSQHLSAKEAPPISSIKGEKYKKYDDAIMQAMSKEAHRRFVDAAEFREELSAINPTNTGNWMSRLFKK